MAGILFLEAVVVLKHHFGMFWMAVADFAAYSTFIYMGWLTPLTTTYFVSELSPPSCGPGLGWRVI